MDRISSSQLPRALAIAGALLFALSSDAMPRAQQEVVPDAALPRTVAEASGWKRTSTHAEVLHFLARLDELPHAARLQRSVFGQSEEGRELPLVIAAAPMPADDAALFASGRLRVLVNANIHAGEVEGKAAVQMLLREFASGAHAELLEELAILFVPIYNPDGNDRIDKRNRPDQNGPDEGVGTRANARDLDLNRDFLKAEAAETRALLGLFQRYDPHLFMDLHTTDGSYHGYHLTYSPSLSTNVDAEIDGFARATLFPELRAAMQARHDLRVFDYGNFSDRGERRWVTYDHRPRFGTNYHGLRNRLSVLSEAYSHLDFEARVVATRAFVLETLHAAARHSARIAELCAAADERVQRGDPAVTFGWDSALAPPVEGEILVGGVERVELPDGLGTRLIASDECAPERMPVQVAFVSRRREPLPAAWILTEATPELIAILRLHGLELERLIAPARIQVESFAPTSMRRAERPFQGHHEIELAGTWHAEERTLPAGSVLIRARQRLGRVAAQLLEPRSEDSLSTWNLFEAATRAASDDESGVYPVLRSAKLPALETEPLSADARK